MMNIHAFSWWAAFQPGDLPHSASLFLVTVVRPLWIPPSAKLFLKLQIKGKAQAVRAVATPAPVARHLQKLRDSRKPGMSHAGSPSPSGSQACLTPYYLPAVAQAHSAAWDALPLSKVFPKPKAVFRSSLLNCEALNEATL